MRCRYSFHSKASDRDLLRPDLVLILRHFQLASKSFSEHSKVPRCRSQTARILCFPIPCSPLVATRKNPYRKSGGCRMKVAKCPTLVHQLRLVRILAYSSHIPKSLATALKGLLRLSRIPWVTSQAPRRSARLIQASLSLPEA